LQGFPDNWTSPSEESVYDENINTLRYTAIGNAVSVPVVEWIANRVKKHLGSNCNTPIEEVLLSLPDYNNTEWSDHSLAEIDFTDTNKEYKWRRGGVAWNGRYLECNVSPTPSKIIKSSLLALIEKNQTNAVYYLSPNAAEGILRRVDGQNRTLFPPLRLALEKLSSNNI